MNEVIKTLLTRRSVRNFTDKKIESEDLNEILKTAIYAPSGMGRQTWQFTAVTDGDEIRKLAGLIEKKLGREGYDFYNPQVLIIPSNEKDSPWGRDDNACALENIFVAAWSMGIGSVWINQLKDVCGDSQVRELFREWGIPDSHVVYGAAALGYPAEEPLTDVEKRGIIKII